MNGVRPWLLRDYTAAPLWRNEWATSKCPCGDANMNRDGIEPSYFPGAQLLRHLRCEVTNSRCLHVAVEGQRKNYGT